MHTRIPKTHFSTPLSGSARETRARIRSIFQGPKKRPPAWLMVLAALSILLCGNLVACQEGEPSSSSLASPDTSVPDASPSQILPGEVLLQAESPEGGEFLLRREEAPEWVEAQSDPVAVLYYRAPDAREGEEEYVATLEYGPDHHYWDTVALTPFTDVLGYDGVVFSHEVGTSWYAKDYYAVTGQGAVLIAPCYNNVYQADLDNDGQPELISNYHAMGYMDMYQRQANGLVVCCSLNEAARNLLSLPEGTWVALSGGETDENGYPLITAQWRNSSGDWQEQVFGEVWALPMVAGAIQGHANYQDGGTERTFLWGAASEAYTMAAYYYDKGTRQELLRLDLSRCPCVTFGEDPLQGQYALGLEPFTDILGRNGALLSYQAGGRMVQHFFYVDQNGQAAPLALCDPGWQVGDLDGDGNDELWSISQNGKHFYLYRADPSPGSQPQCAFVCGGDRNAPQPFRDFDRVKQHSDGAFSFFDSSGQLIYTLTGSELMDLVGESGAWSEHIPTWSDGGRVGTWGV